MNINESIDLQDFKVPSLENLHQPPSIACLLSRRSKVQGALKGGEVALICAGEPAPRNFLANSYMGFRATSHFLYLVGRHLPSAILWLERDELRLYASAPTRSAALWHGEELSLQALSEEIACDVRDLNLLESDLRSVGDILRPPSFQPSTSLTLMRLTGRADDPSRDRVINEALIQARLIHDEEAITQLRWASALTREAHLAGMRASQEAHWAHEIHAAMSIPLISRGSGFAYAPIITPHGEVLHNHDYHTRLNSDDLILADVGAETPQGWAGDVTRTWPKNGVWSPSQAAVYDVVLEALKSSSELASPGIEYAMIHRKAREILTEGLIDLKILKGGIEENLEANSIALFFPHGVGHLLGLDVHDMEDMGDLAGYATGRERRSLFGWGYLRLDRKLQAGMAVTIEPGFYQVPALLRDPTWAGPRAGDYVNWERLHHFKDVRGIRIEDDLLIQHEGAEVLSAGIPVERSALSQVVNRASDPTIG